MKRAILNVLGILAAVAATSAAPDAKSDTFPALGGRAFLNSDAGCFTLSGNATRVGNSGCSGNPRTWLVPMALNQTGATTFRASSNGVSGQIGTFPACHVVVRTQNDASVFIGAQTTIVGAGVSLGSTSVPSAGTGHVDCLLSFQGFALTSVRWSPS